MFILFCFVLFCFDRLFGWLVGWLVGMLVCLFFTDVFSVYLILRAKNGARSTKMNKYHALSQKPRASFYN